MSWFEHGALRIYYEEAGRGDPVMFLPGFSDSISNHTALRDALTSRYRVIAADLPGSGRSQPQPRAYHAGYLRDDADAMCALVSLLTDEPPHILGFSDGGEVALLMGGLRPALPRSIFVWGAVGQISDPQGKTRRTFGEVVDRPAPDFEGYRTYLLSTYGEENARAMTQSFAKALDLIIEAGGDISRSLAGDIACPALLAVGEHDPFNPVALARDYAAAMKDGSAIEVEGAGHVVHEERPEWFLTTLSEWLSKH